MPREPKIAIITPVFNLIKSGRADYIKQNIESIHNQTYKNIEHIVQDGGSTDGTIDILQKYTDKGWIKLYSEKDINVHDAINKAVQKTDAQYIAILGGDDYYKDSDIIEYIVNNYFQHENIEYVYGDEEQISPIDGNYIKTWVGNAYENEFWRGVCFATGTMLFSKKIFNEVNMFDINYSVCADMKLLMDFKFKDYKCAYCNRVVNVFRYGDGLSSSPYTKLKHSYEFVDICIKLWENFDNTITPEKAEYMIRHDEYSEEFLMKLRRYVIGLKLKNIDYVAFNQYIENMISYYYDKKRTKQLAYQAGESLDNSATINTISQDLRQIKDLLFYQNKDVGKQGSAVCCGLYPFKNLPIMKIVKAKDCKKYYLFGKIPVLKMWNENKGE